MVVTHFTLHLTVLLQGGKNRRRGKNENDDEKRELVFKEDGQGRSSASLPCCKPLTSYATKEYAQVTKMLGNGRLQAQCFDGETRLAHIRGKMRKKVWINQGDIILISLREFQDDKADVIVKYTVEEVSQARPPWCRPLTRRRQARNLKQYGELPETTKINEQDAAYGGDEDDEIAFEEDDIDDI